MLQDEIEFTGRSGHACRHEVVVSGCSRAGSRFARHAIRLVLDRDDVSARRRRVERHGHRAAALGDRRVQTDTVGVKDVAATVNVEKGVEVAGRDRLRDREGVVAGPAPSPSPSRRTHRG